jgi:hypothetical protein
MALIHKLAVLGQHGQTFALTGRNDRPRTRQAGSEHKLLPRLLEKIQENFPLLSELWNHGTDCRMRRNW